MNANTNQKEKEMSSPKTLSTMVNIQVPYTGTEAQMQTAAQNLANSAAPTREALTKFAASVHEVVNGLAALTVAQKKVEEAFKGQTVQSMKVVLEHASTVKGLGMKHLPKKISLAAAKKDTSIEELLAANGEIIKAAVATPSMESVNAATKAFAETLATIEKKLHDAVSAADEAIFKINCAK